MSGTVEVELVYLANCPHWREADVRVREAMQFAIVRDGTYLPVEIDSLEAAAALGDRELRERGIRVAVVGSAVEGFFMAHGFSPTHHRRVHRRVGWGHRPRRSG